MRRAVASALLVLGLSSPMPAGDLPPLEYDVKAAFLLNFTRFVDWPRDAVAGSDTFRVCVFRTNPFGETLRATLEGELWQGRPLTPVIVASTRELTSCQVLFLPRAEAESAEDVLAALDGHAVLTVGESSNFLQQGGIVNFVIERDRVRFEINTAASDASNLRVSSKLLRLARNVVPSGRERR
jgi:hypothetical protein